MTVLPPAASAYLAGFRTGLTDNPHRKEPDVTTTDTSNPTTDLLRRLAGEPELVIDEGFQGAPINALTAMKLLERVADWSDEHRHLEVAR